MTQRCRHSSTRSLRPPQSLSVGSTGKGGKLIIKIRKLNRPLSQRHAQHASEKSLIGWFLRLLQCTKLERWRRSVQVSVFHVQFSRAFSASISNMNISFCTIRIIYDRLLERVGGCGLAICQCTLVLCNKVTVHNIVDSMWNMRNIVKYGEIQKIVAWKYFSYCTVFHNIYEYHKYLQYFTLFHKRFQEIFPVNILNGISHISHYIY